MVTVVVHDKCRGMQRALTMSAMVPQVVMALCWGLENCVLVPTPSTRPAVRAVPPMVVTAPVEIFTRRMRSDP